MDKDQKNKKEVLDIVRPQLEKPIYRADGTRLHIIFGLIDRGGHRPEYVDYLCDHITWLHPYVGLTQVDFKKPIIQRSDSKKSHPKLYVGQTRLLSDKVESRIGSRLWHLPDDVTDEYMTQLLAQYYGEEVDEHGQVKREFIRLPNDHYRDCENYGEGVALILELEDKLIIDDQIKRIEEDINKRNAVQVNAEEPKPQENTNRINILHQPAPRRTTPWLAAIKRR